MTEITDLDVGEKITLEKTPNRIQLYRFSAITWNPHRIHYDPEYAREEGHPDVLVQAHLHGAVIQELLLDWAGTEGRLIDLGWRNVGRAVPDEPLSVVAEVTEQDVKAGKISFDVWTENEEGRCAEGKAKLQF